MTSKHTEPVKTLEKYKKQINLDEKYVPETNPISSENERVEIVDSLLHTLTDKEKLFDKNQIPVDYHGKRQLLRALLNMRPPSPLGSTFIKDMDRLLQDELRQKELLDYKDINSIAETFSATGFKNNKTLCLWKGDIACLKTNAIVNAANDQMLGCFQPLHNCIDNVIHSAAGPLLREDCKIIMDIQGTREKTGDAKITRAYNLPSKYVLHTVGPIITGKEVSEFQQQQLASCYRSCLSLAAQVEEIKSIAFPCISTGVYNFPRELAAETAIKAVDEWLENNSHHFTHVIFNVFLKEEFLIYARIFR